MNEGPEVKAPERQPQVSKQLTINNDLMGRLTEIVSSLEDRMSAVLLQSGPQVSEKADQEELVPLAEKVRLNNDKALIQIEKLESILNRLEI